MRDWQPVLHWARTQLDAPVEIELIKTRAWATTWRVQGPQGVSFLKAAGPATHYEAPLLASLHRVAPELMAPVLATEPDAGWVLLGDAGRVLDQKQGAPVDLPVWITMLSRFAELQRRAEPLVADLVAAGVPDERPDRLPDVLRQVLGQSAEAADLTRAERQDLLGRADRWADDEAELAQLALPASVQHGDLHTGNVAIADDGSVRFFDFGDASIAHPFTTLLVPLRLARHLGADDRQLDQLRDGYLEMFTDRAGLPALRRGLDVALRSALLPKATAWERALRSAPDDHPWGTPVLEYLRELRCS